DGSEHGKQALAAALEFVDHKMVKKLVILHVVATRRGVEPMLEAGSIFASSDTEAFEERERDEVVREIEGLIDGYQDITEIVVRVGTPRIEIAHIVDTHNCDLIIIGSRGLGAVRSMLGSVSSSVLTESEVPVFILR
ncbi:MAG: universal stress protein, partial [Raoultibacter sp.]